MIDVIDGTLHFLTEQKQAVFAFTAGISCCAGVSLFLIWGRDLREQRWLLYLSLGYLLWFARYLVEWALHPRVETAGAGSVPGSPEILSIGLSALNSLFLLLAALALSPRFMRELRIWPEVRVGLGICALPMIMSALLDESRYQRLPNQILSLITLFLLARGLRDMVPLGGYQALLRQIAVSTGIWYMFWEVVYSIAPWLPKTEQNGTEAAVYAVLLPAKFSFFLVALYIVTRNIEDLHPNLRRSELLRGGPPSSADEIIEEVGHRVEARISEICLRVPGYSNAEVVWRSMVDKKVVPHKIEPLPSPERSAVGRVLASGRSDRIPDVSATREGYLDRHDLADEIVSTFTVPVRTRIGIPTSHSGTVASKRLSDDVILPVIGALNLEWDRDVPITMTRELQVQRIADQHAPYFEKERELSAIDLLARRASLEEARQAIGSVDDRLLSLAAIAQDLLDPLSLQVRIDLGFSPKAAVASRSAPARILPLMLSKKAWFDVYGSSRAIVLEAPMSISKADPEGDSKTWAETLGVLSLLVPKLGIPVEEPNRPILGTRKFTRRLIASVLADAVLDSFRSSFGRSLKEIERRIGDPALRTSGQWYSALNSALVAEGFCWAGARESKSGRSLWFEKLNPGPETLAKAGAPAIKYRNITVVAPVSPFYGANSIVELRLPAFQEGTLWIGIERAGFGIELDEPPSPWRGFLERLADTAGTALTRIRAHSEIVRLAKESLQARSLIIAVQIAHEMRRGLTSFKENLDSLAKDLKTDQAPDGAELAARLESLRQPANKLHSLSEAFARARRGSDERPVSLHSVIAVVQEILQERTAASQASLTFEIPSQLPRVYVYRTVLELAFHNLVSNSLDACPSCPQITIAAELLDNGTIRCVVADSGPGIPDEIGDPFELGRSTTPGGLGMGLWMARKTLNYESCIIHLLHRSDPGAVFELLMPAAVLSPNNEI